MKIHHESLIFGNLNNILSLYSKQLSPHSDMAKGGGGQLVTAVLLPFFHKAQKNLPL